jgi:signal transduction histidine kinase
LVSDLTKVRQTLFNLISNAAKFTENGQITLSAEWEQDDAGRKWIMFEVADTGIGIPPEKIDEMFDEFTQADVSTTRKYGGTGLGLAITKRFCELLGGSIACRSVVGQGSTFTVRLPAETTGEVGRAVARVSGTATGESGSSRVVSGPVGLTDKG